ncbi:MAG: CZB domain-containing protein [Aquificaceae bacterium]
MMLQELLLMAKDIDLIMASHATYISKLEKSIKNNQPFEHKSHKDCSFGKRFYPEVYARLEEYPPHIRELIEEIEKTHREFHEIAFEVEKASSEEEKLKILNMVKDKSTELFQLLLKLGRVLRKEKQDTT